MITDPRTTELVEPRLQVVAVEGANGEEETRFKIKNRFGHTTEYLVTRSVFSEEYGVIELAGVDRLPLKGDRYELQAGGNTVLIRLSRGGRSPWFAAGVTAACWRKELSHVLATVAREAQRIQRDTARPGVEAQAGRDSYEGNPTEAVAAPYLGVRIVWDRNDQRRARRRELAGVSFEDGTWGNRHNRRDPNTLVVFRQADGRTLTEYRHHTRQAAIHQANDLRQRFETLSLPVMCAQLGIPRESLVA